MLRSLSKSILLLTFLIIIVCGVYPLALWVVGQVFFPFQANGSMLQDATGKIIGSKLIAQPFTKAEYFQPRPSAAAYDASASASSALAASNYALRERVARTLGRVVKYQNGQAVAPDIEKWFQQDTYQGKKNIVAQWAALHNATAQAWVSADPAHAAYVDSWMKKHPTLPQPQAADLAGVFFQNFSKENPGKFPSAEIPALFFDMWRQDHPDVILQNVPGDLVTTSASGLDPHITLQNAEFQLDRVVQAWAAKLKRNPVEIKSEIEQLLQKNTEAPFGGLIGDKFVNVLVVNLELQKKYSS